MSIIERSSNQMPETRRYNNIYEKLKTDPWIRFLLPLRRVLIALMLDHP